ncbi:MAG: S-layer homology domain-containing protein [Thermacetogeniaceae bacterium]
MKRRAVSLLLLAVLLSLLLPGAAAAGTPQFTDTQNHWAKDYIVNFATKGYIEGYPDKTFRPDKPISRAEFTCMLLNCMGIVPGSTSVQSFSDTPKHWAHAQIAEAVRRSILIVSEYPKGFQPDGPILRSEAAAMMVRALGEKPVLTATTFKDNAQVVKSMYHGYIKTASTEGLMRGYTDGTFQPFKGVTRGEACVMLSNLLNKTGSPATPPGSSGSTNNSGTTGLVLQGTRYDLASTPVYIRRNSTNVRISSLSLAGSLASINNSFPFALNAASGNPDLVINNTRYENCILSISGSDVLATPADIKLDSLTYNSYKYNADFVKLYIGNKNSSYYLSDAQLVDTHTVKVADTSYDINNVQVAVALGTDFYAITGISFGISGVNLGLTATSPVVMNGLSLSSVSAIFVANQPLTLSGINTLFFIIDGSSYDLSDVTIDASGNFTANNKLYTPGQVTMVVNTNFYTLINAQIVNNTKFIFYCSASSVASWVKVNDKYRDASGVQIIMGGNVYSLDSVLVVKRNVIRIGGHQYSNSDSIGCRIDGVLYAIEDIDYDSNLDMIIIDTTTATSALTGTVASQPEKYIFYLNDAVYQDGATSAVTIYAGGGWRTFDSITFSDQSHFTYNSSTYSLVGTKVQISGVQFVISDSAWRVSSQTVEIYLQKV